MLQLLFMRHAQSMANAEGRMSGDDRSDRLSEVGWGQVRQLAHCLLRESAPSQVYTSPLQRARQTVEGLLANQAVSTPPIEWEDLREIGGGILAGLTWAEAQSRYPDLCRSLESSNTWIPIPQAESLQHCRDRAHRVVQKLLQSHQNGDRVWVVTHGGFLQHLVAEVLGCDRSWRITIPPTGLFEFWIDCEHWQGADQNRFNPELWQIRRFNDSQHLTQPLI